MHFKHFFRLALVASTIFATFAISSSRAFVVPLQQFGSVVHERNSNVVEQETSTELTSLDLQVGDSSNEAELNIDHLLPAVSPWRGFGGRIFVSSFSFSADRLTQAIFDYDFLLLHPADYAIRYSKQGDATTSFSVSNSTETLISFSDNQSLILEGRFEPGVYSFSIDASAFTTGVFDQEFTQLDFFMFLMPVPEPATLTLAASLFAALLLSKRRR